MKKKWIRRWIDSDLPDEEDARRARLFNALMISFLFGLALFALVGLVGWLGNWFAAGGFLFLISSATTVVAGLIYAINRSGQLRLAVWTFMVFLSAAVVFLLLLFGHRGGAPMFIPTVILAAAVLMRRRAALTSALILGGIYLGLAVVEEAGYWQPWLLPTQERFPPELLIGGRLMGVGMMAILAWLVVGNLLEALDNARHNLERAQRRRVELEQVRASLEQQVRVRTRDLEHALADIQQSAAEKESLLDALRRQDIPVIPILKHIVAVPVVGTLEAARGDRLLSSLLEGIEQYDARVALVDITGVPVVDEAAAHALAQAVTGARMVGAECVLVGINPDIAAALADLDIDLGAFTSRVDMEAGVRYALQHVHYPLTGEPAV